MRNQFCQFFTKNWIKSTEGVVKYMNKQLPDDYAPELFDEEAEQKSTIIRWDFFKGANPTL